MEVAAGLLVAEQIISTTIQAAVVGGYALTRPTNKLKATFKPIATVPNDDSPDSLARASHSANIVDGDLYIFGGKVSTDRLAGNEMHILKLSNIEGLGPQYKVVPALARDGDDVPQARAGHTACIISGKIVMFGGYGDSENSEPLQEGGRVWIFDPSTFHWSHLDVANERYPQCHSHAAVAYGNTLIIHGGYSSATSSPTTNTWSFDLASRTWKELPALSNDLPGSSPISASAPPNFALANDKLYLISGSSALESQIYVHSLLASPPSSPPWKTLSFPTNPLTPGPRPRRGAGLIPISTATGRHYLLMMLGAKDATSEADIVNEKQNEDSARQEDFWSAIWSLQLPATSMTPSLLKDSARATFNMDSGEAEWAEVEIMPPENPDPLQGKVHPGPRGYFACDPLDSRKIVLWGGLNPRGEVEGDGWMIEVKAG